MDVQGRPANDATTISPSHEPDWSTTTQLSLARHDSIDLGRNSPPRALTLTTFLIAVSTSYYLATAACDALRMLAMFFRFNRTCVITKNAGFVHHFQEAL